MGVTSITPSVPNVIDRDFHANAPNEKWLTDITEFSIPAGKIYLSPVVDCFDGLIPCWKIGSTPDAELVNRMLDDAIKMLKEGEHPLLHTDRGCHYRWPGWISRMEAAGLQRSMSRKGCSPDNSACEGLFGRLKNEMFYNRDWKGVSIQQFIQILNEAKAETEIPDKSATYIVYCRSGSRSAAASAQLVEMGYENIYDLGGINDWPYDKITGDE